MSGAHDANLTERLAEIENCVSIGAEGSSTRSSFHFRYAKATRMSSHRAGWPRTTYAGWKERNQHESGISHPFKGGFADCGLAPLARP